MLVLQEVAVLSPYAIAVLVPIPLLVMWLWLALFTYVDWVALVMFTLTWFGWFRLIKEGMRDDRRSGYGG